ncbi:DUF4224 domain-containing protein [Comamonadaceae bacterium M7527]|nr:DUF4224 domain-containing protein [Comamonadaceae bacterium M7527]
MAEEEFMHHEEIEQLCGFVRASKQIAWLAANGYPYVLNASGRPIVSRMFVRQRLGVDIGRGAESDEPNFDCVR